MSVPSGQSILTELPDLDLTKVDWLAALNAATLTASTAFLPNLIGKLMQFAALEEVRARALRVTVGGTRTRVLA
eukprot:6203437-Pleurochrysis_carterae.AAC.2